MAEFKPQVLLINGTPFKWECRTQEELKKNCSLILTWFIETDSLSKETDGQTDMFNRLSGYSTHEIAQQIIATEDELVRLVRSYHFLMTTLADRVTIELL